MLAQWCVKVRSQERQRSLVMVLICTSRLENMKLVLLRTKDASYVERRNSTIELKMEDCYTVP